jgi:hypothetical protein
MSWVKKIAQSVAQNFFCRNQHRSFSPEKKWPKTRDTSVIKKNCPKKTINRPLGENWPNLVTLPPEDRTSHFKNKS